MLLLPQAAEAQQQWTPELSLKVKRLSDLSFSPDGKALLYGINTTDLENDAYLTEFVISDLDGNRLQTLLEPAPHHAGPQWSPDGTRVAYLSSQSGRTNIWSVDADGGDKRQLTDAKKDISSFKWAPDGRSIAFVMADPDYQEPVVENPAVFNKTHLWLLTLDGGAIRNLTAGQDFTVSDWGGGWVYDWAPDGKAIVFAYQAAPGLDSWTEAQLAIADLEAGGITKIVTDNAHWKYFPKYSPDGNWIAFVNAPGPFKWSFLWDIKLIPATGGKTVQLPKTKSESPIPWQWAADSQSLFYVENDRATFSFYRMPIDGRPPAKIFGAPEDLNVPGVNTYLVSSFIALDKDNDKLAIVGQSYNKPPEVYIGDLEGFAPQKITKENQAFTTVPIGETQLVHWRSLDGTPVEGLLTYPQSYGEGQRYPLVVQIHGGPNGADFNEYLPLMKYFATAAYSAKGYFVLRVNYRGSLGYGRKFSEELVGNFGVLDYQDIISGVDHVIDLGLADPEQLFLIGQSNGGTLTSWIITQSDRFKSACPVAGETDFISLEGTNEYFQTSWYMGGSFIDHLQMFLDRSPIFHVKNAKTPTLIQGGLLDGNVPFSQLREFYRALKRVGVEAHLVGYPDSDHEFYPPKLYLRLLQSCLDWTEQHRTKAPT
ncbi:MAG: S9 family peptidase [Pseudomonadota bacterium]